MTASIEIEQSRYEPGSAVRGRVTLLFPPGEVELAVLWETEGKGSTDLGVVFHRVLQSVLESGDEHSFETTLPLLPLTYDGHLLKIAWRVRVRFLGGVLGQDTVVDRDFVVAWPT